MDFPPLLLPVAAKKDLLIIIVSVVDDHEFLVAPSVVMCYRCKKKAKVN